jgi:hypothetical protein
MNERIKELAKEAGFEIDNGPLLPGLTTITMKVGGLYVGVPVEKFAELIVRECIDKIETYRIPVGNSAAGEMACEWTYDALKEIRDEIKQHFGIEP